MKTNSLRALAFGLLVVSTITGMLRADLRNEIIPPGMVPPFHKYTGLVPATSGPTGYTPRQMRHADGFDQLNTAGEGQVIAIIDACGSPTIQADLDAFCATFNIPSTTVHVYYPQGFPCQSDRNGWDGATSLDVGWAHAIAPGATIVLVASSPSGCLLTANNLNA